MYGRSQQHTLNADGSQAFSKKHAKKNLEKEEGQHGSSRSEHRRTAAGKKANRSASPMMMLGNEKVSLSPSSSVGSQSHSSMMDGLLQSSMHSPASRSPYHSPAHSRSSSMTSVRSSRDPRNTSDRDPRNTSDRDPRNTNDLHDTADMPRRHTSLANSNRHVPHSRDRSLDRQLQRYREMDRYHTYSGHSRDKSADRTHDYPHMGAKSLERDSYSTNMVRSRSIDYDFANNQAAFLPQEINFHSSSDSLVLELQTQLAELNKDCSTLQHELNLSREKLASSMNSIKTFWSPELKKERAFRKEESAKYGSLTEQLKSVQIENMKQVRMIEELENQLREQGGEVDPKTREMLLMSSSQIYKGQLDMVNQDKERQAKEMLLLRKTVDEMELRIDTQKQTLSAREESIKKLLEMMQNKGMSVAAFDEGRLEAEGLRNQLLEEKRRVKHLESVIGQKDSKIQNLIKDSTLDELDLTVKNLQQEAQASSPTEIVTLKHQIQNFHDQQTVNKSKMSILIAEAAQKDSEISTANIRIGTIQDQMASLRKQVDLLKAKIQNKDAELQSLRSEQSKVFDLRSKADQAHALETRQSSLREEKQKLELQVSQYKDTLDIKERKINVLHRKIENLEETVKDNDDQLGKLRSKVVNLQVEHTNVDAAFNEQVQMSQKHQEDQRRHKDMYDKKEASHQKEIEVYNNTIKNITSQAEKLHHELGIKEQTINKLQTELKQSSSVKTTNESQFTKLNEQLSQKTAEQDRLHQQLQKLRDDTTELTAKDQEQQRQLARQKQHLEQMQKLRDDHTELTAKDQEQQRQLARQKQHLDQLQKLREDTTEMTAKDQEQQRQLARQMQHLDQLNNQVSSLQKSLAQAEKVAADYKHQLDIMRGTLDDNKKESEGMKQDFVGIRQEVTMLRQQSEAYRKEVVGLQKLSNDLKSELQKARQQTDGNKKEGEAYRKQATDAAKECAIVKEQLAAIGKEALKLKDQSDQYEKEVRGLREQCEKQKKQSAQAQTETDRLLDILKVSENEKYELDKQIRELQDKLRGGKFPASPQPGRRDQRKPSQSEEPADTGQLKTLVEDQLERIEELEEALKESVKITAQRELVLAKQEDHIDISERQIEYLTEELERMHEKGSDHSQHITDLKQQIDARDKQLNMLQGDRGKQLSEIFEMKQEALSAAITEKDAHIALLEIAPNRKTENIIAVEQLTKEKIKLQHHLKDLSEKRLKLIGERNKSEKH